MKISEGLHENGVIIGNNFDKYNSKNPIVRWIMKCFDNALSSLITQVTPRSIHEVGCGEGYWVLNWNQQGIKARGSDFSEQVVKLARENAKNCDLSPNIFSVRSIYDIGPEKDSADLIVCCEVLEHLEDPVAGLKALQRVATDYVILSVPHEPIWRILNLIRGKYFTSFGNTPGHIQHWSKKAFVVFISSYFDIIEIKSPMPWTMILCRIRK